MITAQQYIYNSRKEGIQITSHKHLSNTSKDRRVGKEGDVYILLSIAGANDSDTDRFGKIVIESILEGYLYSSSKSTNESVKNALDDGVKKVKELIKNSKEISPKGLDVNFSITVFKKEGAYIGVVGDTDVYLYKSSGIVNISDIMLKKKANTVGIVVKENDILVVSTKEKITENISKISRAKSPEEFVEILNIIGKNLVSPSGLIYFSNIKKEIQEKTELISQSSDIKSRGFEISKYLPKKEVLKNLRKKLPSVNIAPFWGKVKYALSRIYSFLQNSFEYILSRVRNRRWYKKIAAKMAEIKLPKSNIRREGVRVDEYKIRDTRFKRFRLVGTVLLVLLLIALGVNFTVTKKKERELAKYANEKFVEIDQLLDKVEADWRLDRDSAETSLFKAENIFKEVPSDLKEKDLEEMNTLKSRMESIGDTIYKRVGISEENGKMSKYLEARLAFGEGSEPTDLDIYQDKDGSEYLFVSDSGRNIIYRVSLYDKAVKELPDENKLLAEPQYISVGKNGVYVYDKRIGMLKNPFDGNGWFKTTAELSGLSLDDIKATDITEMIVLTDSDNIYLLSRDLMALLKSTPAYGDRYGLSYPYLEKDIYTEAVDVFADLSVYITTRLEPKLVRYNYSYVEQKLAEAPISTTGFDGYFGNITKGFTRGDMKKGLFLFDSENKRFFKFEKPLEGGGEILHPDQILLLNQYIYRGGNADYFKNVKDIVVDAKESNMYVLDSSVIWKIAL